MPIVPDDKDWTWVCCGPAQSAVHHVWDVEQGYAVLEAASGT